VRGLIAQIIVGAIYFPLTHSARVLGSRGKDVLNFPLLHYTNMPLVRLQKNTLDYFGSKLEERFSKEEIVGMLESAGLMKLKLFTQTFPLFSS
jgi:hypothetical protein